MSRNTKNILFIMYDQLRHDYLSCAGHKTLHTPNMDRLAAMGIRFTNTYVQSPVCGASRMSFYTGRYVSSHGAAWNNFPLKVGEQTLGDHLRNNGVKSWLVGKTHMKVDAEGMVRLGISADSVIGARVSECGFDIFERDDGLWAEGPSGFYDEKLSPYNEYLKSKGYEGENPWRDYANSADDDGQMASGWFMRHASKPANIAEEDSETPYLTSRIIDFLEEHKDGDPWMCHASFIKPHWPYIVPAPYHNMYGHNHIQPVNRHPSERVDPNPIYAQFQNNAIGQAFSRDEVRKAAIPAYMGLIKQCDDQLGRLLDYLETSGRMQDTMIVLTSDHGDYLGDHWLGEKDLFHEPSVKVPLIIYDPDTNDTRGTTVDALVEAIDLAPTFVEAIGGEVPANILEGRSLMPFLRGESPDDWREFVISEYDYSATQMCANLGMEPKDARLFMVATGRYTFVHSEGGFRPMLFDRLTDPDELTDLGQSDAHGGVIAEMYEHLAKWGRRMSQRTTISDAQIEGRRAGAENVGMFIGAYDEAEFEAKFTEYVTGRAKPRPKSGK
ncbi:MAG: sulfatase-like hydrolase/transferase [Paracoccaceae bacterium]